MLNFLTKALHFYFVLSLIICGSLCLDKLFKFPEPRFLCLQKKPVSGAAVRPVDFSEKIICWLQGALPWGVLSAAGEGRPLERPSSPEGSRGLKGKFRSWVQHSGLGAPHPTPHSPESLAPRLRPPSAGACLWTGCGLTGLPAGPPAPPAPPRARDTMAAVLHLHLLIAFRVKLQS